MKRWMPILAVVLFTGCATIVGSKTQLMPINSSPDEADITITDESGSQMFKGKTPTAVTLEKSTGKYWGGKSYSVKISKKGFEPVTISVKSSPNGWYLAGNLIFGGLIGWFIVDPLNGAMYTLSPENLSTTLGKKTAYKDGTVISSDAISIMLLEDVPQDMRAKLQRIN